MSYHDAKSIRLIARYFLLSFIILSLISSSAFAKKPIRLTDQEMAEVEGAIAPLVYLAEVLSCYSVSVGIDLALDPVFREAAKGMAASLLHGDLEEAEKKSDVVLDKFRESATDSTTIALCLGTPLVKELFSGVKLAKTAINGKTTGPLASGFNGAKREIYEEGAEAVYQIPVICLDKSNRGLNQGFIDCAVDQLGDRLKDPTLYFKIGTGINTSVQASKVSIGSKGTQLYKDSQDHFTAEKTNDLNGMIGRSSNSTLTTKKPLENNEDLSSLKVIGGQGIKFIEAVMPRTTQAIKDSKQEVANNISQAQTAQSSGGSGGGGGSSGRSSSTAVTFDCNRLLANIKQGVAEVNKATGKTGSPFDLSRYSSSSQSKSTPAASAAPAATTTYVNHAAEGRVTPPSNVRTIADNRADIARRTAAISGTPAPKSSSSTSSSKPSSSSSSRSSSSGKK